jgi:chloride channel protein, CIC family
MWGTRGFRHATKWFGLAVLVGIVAGLGAIVFQALSEAVFDGVLRQLAGYQPRELGGEPMRPLELPPLRTWVLVLAPAVGGLLSGLIVWRFAPEAEGHGTDAVLEAYHRRAGNIPWRVPIVKLVASAITLGSGGSGGREGPIAQIGAGFGSLLARRLGLGVKERRILLAAGLGAGVGAIFRAPLAGALFASEIHYRDTEFESEAVIPSAIASITAFCLYSMFHGGGQALFSADLLAFEHPQELLPYTVLAAAVTVGGLMFVRVFYGLRDMFKKVAAPQWLKPVIGGLGTGLLGVALYYATRDKDSLSVMAFGYGAVQGALDGKLAIGILLLVAVGKMVTTGLTIGSGGSGGVFGPSMVIGGCIGGAVGLGIHQLAPELVPHPGAYVLVGMAGFFAGVANTPISTIIMVSEMTGNYALLLPSLWVCAICYLSLRNVSLYEKQHQSKIDSPAHRGDFHFDVLENMRVRDVFSPEDLVTFSQNTPLGAILPKVAETRQDYFPVLDGAGKLCGVFSLADVREFLYDEDVWAIAIAADLATTHPVRVLLDDDLSLTMRRFGDWGLDAVPVVADDDPDRLLGLLRRKDVIDAYNQRILKLAHEAPESRV